ncbi:MAG: peptidyl-prolyl cis-trans isomerase [Ignavibacteriaceae bacterium]|nr:peptidyl-prolyl cis-trans isomerase [Ignavibacteriaceae bacterium]
MIFSFFRTVLILLAATVSITVAQKAPLTIAEIGKERITDTEFRIRYELSPFITQKSDRDIAQRKSDFLFSLITEKLWYLEALNSGMSESQLFRFYYQPIEDIHLRDALFKKEISDKVKLSADDVTNAMMFAGIELKTAVIAGTDSVKLFSLYNALISSAEGKHDSVLSTYRSSGLSLHQFAVSLGSMKDAEVENYLFTLKQGECSSPLRSELGWTMFLIREKTSKPVEISNQSEVNRIKEIVRNRKILLKTEEYFANLLTNIRIDINEENFRFTAEAIYNKIRKRYPDGFDTSMGKLTLSDRDFRELLSEFAADNLKRPLFTLGGETATVFDFLAKIAFDVLTYSSAEKTHVYQRLNVSVKTFVQSRILTMEAKRLGLLQLEGVQHDLMLWKESMLAHFLKLSMLDSTRVSDDEVRRYYETDIYNDRTQVYLNLQILTLTQLSDVEDALRRITEGASFDEVTRSFGETDQLADSVGMTGLKPAAVLGSIGTIASSLELNQLYGPVRRENGNYSLLMVKEKQRSSDAPVIDYDKDKEHLRNYLAHKNITEYISDKTAELFKKYGVRVNEQLLSSIKTNDVYMFTHRLMGFGGRISAVPLLDNWADWINVPQLKKVLLP